MKIKHLFVFLLYRENKTLVKIKLKENKKRISLRTSKEGGVIKKEIVGLYV